MLLFLVQVDLDTKYLWIADFLIWGSEYCDENFFREDFSIRRCGRDAFNTNTSMTCESVWVPNTLGLRTKLISAYNDSTCYPFEGGICRPAMHLHPKDQLLFTNNETQDDDVFCPTIRGWPDEHWKFCLREWRIATEWSGSDFVFEGYEEETLTAQNGSCSGDYVPDEEFIFPMKHSASPNMFAFDLFSHQDTLDMILETREFCDDDEEVHCWLTGTYWLGILFLGSQPELFFHHRYSVRLLVAI